jgi:hypothetical protein
MVLINLAVVAGVGFLVWRLGRDRRVEGIPSARWLRIAALVFLAVPVAIELLFGVGEMLGGDLSGAVHLLGVAVTALLAILVWMRPLEGGVLLCAGAGTLTIILLTAVVRAGGAVVSPAIWIQAAPQVISGVLFFIAGLLGQRAAGRGAGSAG